MTGESKLSPTQEKIKKMDHRVNQLYEDFGITLDLFDIDVKSLDGDECIDKATGLSSVAFTVQQEVNKLQAKYNFIGTQLKRMIDPVLQNYSAFKDEAKFNQALMENELARLLHDEQTTIKFNLDVLKFLPQRIDKMYDLLVETARNRRSQR